MIHQFTLIEKMLLKKGAIPQPIMDADACPGLGKSLMAAVKTGLTDQLSNQYQQASILAGKAGLNEDVTPLVLDCLEALGYVDKKASGYAFSKIGWKFLSKDSPSNLINFILFNEMLQARSTVSLDEILRTGRKPKDNLKEFSEEEWKLFTLAMEDLAGLMIDEVTKAIPAPPNPRKLLDLGGSHGLYSIYQCQKHPQLKAEIFDLEEVRPYLDKNIEKHKMAGRVSQVVGDFLTTKWDLDYDMVFAFNIIHGLNEEENQHLFLNAFQSLNKKGIFVILDQVKGVDGKSQMSRAVPAYMGLNLYIQAGGRTYSRGEITKSLKEAGFSSVKIKALKTPGLALVIGTK